MKLGKTIVALAAGIALAFGSTISAQAAETTEINTEAVISAAEKAAKGKEAILESEL